MTFERVADVARSPIPSGAAVLAFDVGGTDIKSALIDEDGSLLGLTRTPTPHDGANTVGALLDVLERIAGNYAQRFGHVTARAAGLIVPGLVDDDRGVAILASNLDWHDVAFGERAGERLGLPVAFGHDVRTAGAAEYQLGAAASFTDVAVIVVGTGIASALFVNGSEHVAGGFAGELGHSIVMPDGPLCGCGGRGHLEAIASAGAIARRYTERTGIAVPGAREVVEFARAGDADAQAVWDDAVEALALALAQVVSLLAPEAIVIGGGLAQAGPVLFDPLAARLDQLLTFHRRPALLAAQIGENAGLIGAALRARELLERATVTATVARGDPR